MMLCFILLASHLYSSSLCFSSFSLLYLPRWWSSSKILKADETELIKISLQHEWYYFISWLYFYILMQSGFKKPFPSLNRCTSLPQIQRWMGKLYMSPSGDFTLTLQGNQASSGKNGSGFLSSSISTSLPREVGQHTENLVVCRQAKKVTVG